MYIKNTKMGRGSIMYNILEQKEALETLTEFNQRLLKNMNIIIKELSGERMDDTDEFLKAIIDAMNWEIGVMNGTMSLLNNEKIRINKETFNEKAIKLATAVQNKKDNEIADAIKLLIPEFENLGNAAQEVIA